MNNKVKLKSKNKYLLSIQIKVKTVQLLLSLNPKIYFPSEARSEQVLISSRN